MTLSISQDHRDARSQATIAFADSGTGPSIIRLMDENSTELVVITLAEPCGSLVNGLIELTQASAMGDQILTDGVAATGVWLTSNGEIIAEGTVSDAAGTGDFKISSAAGASLYAGGYVILGTTSLS